jgi:hypothetical protein
MESGESGIRVIRMGLAKGKGGGYIGGEQGKKIKIKNNRRTHTNVVIQPRRNNIIITSHVSRETYNII